MKEPNEIDTSTREDVKRGKVLRVKQGSKLRWSQKRKGVKRKRGMKR